MLEEDGDSINSNVEEVDTTKTPNDDGPSKFHTPDVNAPIPDLDTSLEALDEPEQCSVDETYSETSNDIAGVIESNSVAKEPSSLIEEVPKVQEVTVTVPEVVKTLEVSKTPEVIRSPEVTKAPEPARAPEVTKAPEATQAPEVRRALEVTKTPEVIKLLGVTKVSEVTKAKEATRVPEAVKVTEVVKVPKVLKVAEVTKVPEVVKLREIAKSIEPSKQPASKIPEQMPLALDVPKVEPLAPKIEKKEKSEAKTVSLDVEMMEVAPVEEKKLMPAVVAVDKPRVDERMEQREKTMPLNGDIAKVYTCLVFLNAMQLCSLCYWW